MFNLSLNTLLSELHTRGSFLLPLRIFIGLGWLRAGLAKMMKPAWHSGEALNTFLADHLSKGDIIFPPYEFIVNNVFLPNVAILSWVVMIGQVLTGIGILSGTITNLALMMGLIMNLNFILCGAPNPSAFYVVIQIVLFLANTGSILGFDKILSKKIHYEFLIAQPEHKTIRPAVEKNFFLSLVFITVASALYALFYIEDFSPNSVHDQAMVLFVLANISATSFFIKYYYLTKHMVKILVVDDEQDAVETMSDLIEESFDIEILKAYSGAEARDFLMKDPNIVLIVSDYNMPTNRKNDIDGGGLYQYNKTHRNLPFLLFSSEKVEDHKELLGFYNDNLHNSVIGKPYDGKTVTKCIENVVVFYML